MSKELEDIKRLAGISENDNRIQRKHDLSHDIWIKFKDVIDDVEELKKVTGDGTYLRILKSMANEIAKRTN